MCRATIGVRGIEKERVCANGRSIEVARVRITEAAGIGGAQCHEVHPLSGTRNRRAERTHR